MLDIRQMDDEKHKRLTGRSNRNTLAFAAYLAERERPVWLRYVLCPTLTDAESDLVALRTFADSLHNVEKIELLPYHTMGVEKYEKLGIPYPLEGIEPPTSEMVARAKMLLEI